MPRWGGVLRQHVSTPATLPPATLRCKTAKQFCLHYIPLMLQISSRRRCDGRDTKSPTASPAPTNEGVVASTPDKGNADGAQGTTAAWENICSLCGTSKLESNMPITFNAQATTCANLEGILSRENIKEGSATCTAVQEQYRNTCCYEECQLCQTPDKGFLDLRSDHVVTQGGYEARCDEIDSILSTSSAKGEKICTDAQLQFGSECCYQQCTLCGDNPNMSTEWYATVTYNGLATTCLGLDYMLRVEKISDGTDRCSELQRLYTDRCCYSAFAANSCQLCRVDDKLYEIFPSKTVTVEQSPSPQRTYARQQSTATTTCSAINDSLTSFDSSDRRCTEGKQEFFGECCDFGNSLVGSGPTSIGLAPGFSPSSAAEAPRPSAIEMPSSTAETSGSGGAQMPSSALPAETSSPKGRPVPVSTAPTPPYYWGTNPSPDTFEWEQIWDPPQNSGTKHTALLFVLALPVLSRLIHSY